MTVRVLLLIAIAPIVPDEAKNGRAGQNEIDASVQLAQINVRVHAYCQREKFPANGIQDQHHKSEQDSLAP